jgi:hypothetical protein
MRLKIVYVNDKPIGKAATWAQANALLAIKGVHFSETPKRVEGPQGFYMQGPLVEEPNGAESASGKKTDQGVA